MFILFLLLFLLGAMAANIVTAFVADERKNPLGNKLGGLGIKSSGPRDFVASVQLVAGAVSAIATILWCMDNQSWTPMVVYGSGAAAYGLAWAFRLSREWLIALARKATAALEAKKARDTQIRQRSKEVLIARAREGILRAAKAFDVTSEDAIPFQQAGEEMVGLLEKALEWEERLASQLEEPDADPEANRIAIDQLYPDAKLGTSLGDLPQKVERGYTALVLERRHMQEIIENVVFLCRNLWIETSRAEIADEFANAQQIRSDLRDAVQKIDAAVQAVKSSSGSTILDDFQSGELIDQLTSYIGSDDEANRSDDAPRRRPQQSVH